MLSGSKGISLILFQDLSYRTASFPPSYLRYSPSLIDTFKWIFLKLSTSNVISDTLVFMVVKINFMGWTAFTFSYENSDHTGSPGCLIFSSCSNRCTDQGIRFQLFSDNVSNENSSLIFSIRFFWPSVKAPPNLAFSHCFIFSNISFPNPFLPTRSTEVTKA